MNAIRPDRRGEELVSADQQNEPPPLSDRGQGLAELKRVVTTEVSEYDPGPGRKLLGGAHRIGGSQGICEEEQRRQPGDSRLPQRRGTR